MCQRGFVQPASSDSPLLIRLSHSIYTGLFFPFYISNFGAGAFLCVLAFFPFDRMKYIGVQFVGTLGRFFLECTCEPS